MVLSFEEYMILRRDTVGARPSFDMMEFALDIDLPDEVFSDAAFQRAYYAAIDMIALANVSCIISTPNGTSSFSLFAGLTVP